MVRKANSFLCIRFVLHIQVPSHFNLTHWVSSKVAQYLYCLVTFLLKRNKSRTTGQDLVISDFESDEPVSKVFLLLSLAQDNLITSGCYKLSRQNLCNPSFALSGQISISWKYEMKHIFASLLSVWQSIQNSIIILFLDNQCTIEIIAYVLWNHACI